MKNPLLIVTSWAVFAAVLLSAPRAETCVPGCSGYHLTFTGPGGPNGSGLATADGSASVTWQDTLDGSGATFDILASADSVPAYPMHTFPAELPGQILALGLSATAQSAWTWDTSRVAAGTYFLYAVFHNSPFNTLVMPFAVVAVAHGAVGSTTSPVAPAVFVRSPRGTNAASGSVTVALDAAGGAGTTVDLYAGAPPDAANPVLVAQGLPSALAQTVSWDSRGATGEVVFKAVLRDASGNALASALSPGTIVASTGPSSGCGSGVSGRAGDLAPIAMALLLGLRRRQRALR